MRQVNGTYKGVLRKSAVGGRVALTNGKASGNMDLPLMPQARLTVDLGPRRFLHELPKWRNWQTR